MPSDIADWKPGALFVLDDTEPGHVFTVLVLAGTEGAPGSVNTLITSSRKRETWINCLVTRAVHRRFTLINQLSESEVCDAQTTCASRLQSVV